MHPHDVPKTAFICNQGKFEFLRMPFGVHNAPAVFQELMQKLFRDCKAFCLPYMDYLIIYSDSWEAHVAHVREVLKCLRVAGQEGSKVLSRSHWILQEVRGVVSHKNSGTLSSTIKAGSLSRDLDGGA